jgi:hypothetical protein
MYQQRSLYFGLGQIGVVVAAVIFGGLVNHPGDPPHVFTMLGGSSLLTLVVGALVGMVSESPVTRWGGLGGAIAQGLYVCFVMSYEPFLDPPYDMLQAVTITLWVLPVLLAGILFARIGCWGQALATSVFLFACVALITFNTCWTDEAGFLTRIRR